MNSTSLKAFQIILVSLGLALTFNFFFFQKLIGISAILFTFILLASIFLFALYQKLAFRKSLWLIFPILFFALMFAIRANEFLSFLNFCAIFGLLMLLAYDLSNTRIFAMKIKDYFLLIFLAPFAMLFSALQTVSLVGRIYSTVKKQDIWLRILKGVIMATPVLLIFGVLFSQADLVFSVFINSIFNINISESTMQYIALLLFAFIAALCFLSYIFFPKNAQNNVVSENFDSELQFGRVVEISVFLGLIASLFFIFIAFQVVYLFEGGANIIDVGFTYAEYARRGFWELLAVAIISLLVLLASEKYSLAELRKTNYFLIPALTLVAEVMVVMLSAFKRLSLYIDAYSMTTLRFYVAGFIMLLFLIFALLAVKFIKSKKEHFFTFNTLVLVILFLASVNIINPDTFIAKINLEEYNKNGKIDVLYIGRLSADAIDLKIELYKKLEGEDKNVLLGLLQNQKSNLEKNSLNWQSLNLSRAHALKILEVIDF